MKNLRPDTDVKVTTQDYELISHEKAYVKMTKGCLWVYLLEDDVRIGIAFVGPSTFAVDAIAETKMGAMGESVRGELSGVQLYIGVSSLENISQPVKESDIQEKGFTNTDSLIQAIESTISEHVNGENKTTRFDTKEKSQILFGKDTKETKIILVLSEKEGLVFIYGKQVFVLGDDNMVSVSKSGVVVTSKDGKQIIVGKDGIHGIDSFLDIGQLVSESITSAMSGLHGLKSLKSMKRTMKDFPYDNVDDFDWED
ncbi:hypothetical protein EU527_09305 [Candidatus Thorarchaeota archaeon]|nr:MAG: hypothetical protein EU527_09305 [Candidatus Thorarchaeota archaeon]